MKVKEQAFIINGEKKFIYGGELHYFRVPKKDWADRIKKIKEAGCNLVSTYIPWIWHESEEGNIDLTGKTTPERDLLTFLKMVEKQEMYCFIKPGPYVMSEIKNHGVPYWVNEKYPEVVAKKQNGQNHPTGVVSYLHPTFLKLVDRWYKAVCEVVAPLQITEGGNIIMFQLDNEVGMLQWVTNQADYNDETLLSFLRYIEAKYSLQELSGVLNVQITDYKQLINMLKNPEEEYAVKFQNELMLFMRKYYHEYIETLRNMAIKYDIKVPFVVNVHGFDTIEYAKRGIKYPIGLSQLYEAVKSEGVVAAGDYYIGNIVHENYHDIVLANAFTKAIQNENQPLFSAEFQSGFQFGIPRLQPTTFDLTTRLCIANGMNSLNFYMFVGGENYENIGLLGKRHDWQAPVGADGSLRKHYYTIQYLANVIRSIEKELLNSKINIVTHLGFYADYYMTEYSNEFTKEMYDKLRVFREAFLYNGIGRALTLNNITYGGYDINSKTKIDVNKIKSLWILSSHWMDETIQQKLINYVEEGGKLVLFPALPTMDMKGNPCTKLIDALKVEIDESFFNKFVVIDGIDSVGAGYIETYKGNDLRSFAYPEEKPEKCCAFEKDLGRGKVIVLGLGLEMDQPFKDYVIKKIAERVDNHPITNGNDYIDVSFRSIKETGTRFMFIQNYDEYAKSMVFDYFGEELFDGSELTIGPRSGLILPLNYELKNGTKLIYTTCELIDNKENEIQVFCKQNTEMLKFNRKVTVLTEGIEHEITKQAESYKLTLKNCLNKKVLIKL